LFAEALGALAVRPSALLENVITGMDQLHRLGWAHNDIKPDNVLLEVRHGVVNFVICDYGLAGRFDRLDFARGTDGYRFPFRETRIIGRHADYWAVGILSAEVMSVAPFLAPWDLA
jgi:calcium-dependent protein kinase